MAKMHTEMLTVQEGCGGGARSTRFPDLFVDDSAEYLATMKLF